MPIQRKKMKEYEYLSIQNQAIETERFRASFLKEPKFLLGFLSPWEL